MRLIDADVLLSRLKKPTVEDINEVLRVEYDNAPSDTIAAEAVFNMYESVREAIEGAPTISPRWTPCAEGMPTKTANYKVTVQVGSEMGTWRETKIIPYRIVDGVGSWILPKSDWLIYGVIAWTKADEPWTGGLDGK